ncbi:MAG TPA: hypothetical protein VHZ03_53280, partial [Trebonia sp.]|nr:hypothetical protein [Trebonia sp.]
PGKSELDDKDYISLLADILVPFPWKETAYLGISAADRIRNATILGNLIALDDYIKFHNLVQHVSNVRRGSRDPIYLELFDTSRGHVFKKEVNHFASMKISQGRRYLLLKTVER